MSLTCTLLPTPTTITLCERWPIHLWRPVLGQMPVIIRISGTSQISPFTRQTTHVLLHTCKNLPYWSDNFQWCALIGSKDRVIDLTQIPFEGAKRQLYIGEFLLLWPQRAYITVSLARHVKYNNTHPGSNFMRPYVWKVSSVTCRRSVVSSGCSGFLHQKTDFTIISPPWYDPGCSWGVKPQ